MMFAGRTERACSRCSAGPRAGSFQTRLKPCKAERDRDCHPTTPTNVQQFIDARQCLLIPEIAFKGVQRMTARQVPVDLEKSVNSAPVNWSLRDQSLMDEGIWKIRTGGLTAILKPIIDTDRSWF